MKPAAGGGYLANVAPSELAQLYEEALPATLTGREFTAAYRRHWDAATQARCLSTAHPRKSVSRVYPNP